MSGNFLQRATSATGVTPSFARMFVVYSTAKDVAITSLTAAAINAEITAGTAIGIIQGWNNVAGANVAEKAVEKLDSSMKVNKLEVFADTLTFSDNVADNALLGELVLGGTYNCLLIDDQGMVFGQESTKAGYVHTMQVNFSTKASNGLQSDRTNEKTVSVIARYLVDDIGYVDAGTAVEDVVVKAPLSIKVSSLTTHTSSSIVVVLNLTNKLTGDLLTTFVTTSLVADVKVNGINVTASGAFANNALTLTLAKTSMDFNTATDRVSVKLSTESYFTLKPFEFNISQFIV